VDFRIGLDRQPFGLVGCNDEPPAARTQSLRNSQILRGNAFARVKDEHHDIAFSNSLLRLLRHLAHDAFRGDRLETPVSMTKYGTCPTRPSP